MQSLSADQQALVAELVRRLQALPGIAAIALGGSYARGRARPDSDIDLGLYYTAASPIDVATLRALASELHDQGDPVVSEIGGWGRWVDGGAWLAIGGQRVDLLYRSFELIESVLDEAAEGRFSIDFDQQPPFGFFGPTVLGEVAIAQPLYDPEGRIARFKSLVSPMPEALAAAIVQQRMWSIDFGLRAFVPKYVAAGNVLAVAGCMTRFAQALVHTIFALNLAYPLNDKTTLAEISGFALAPREFAPRIEALLAAIGSNPDELAKSVAQMTDLFEEARQLCGELYAPSWAI